MAKIVSGPLKDMEIGLRFEAMHERRLSGIFNKRSHSLTRLTGQELNLNLTPWDVAIQQNGQLATVMIYDETDLDLLAPTFYVTGGALSVGRVRDNRKR